MAANVIRPTTRPGTRLSRKPSLTQRALPNFCATTVIRSRSVGNELPLVLLDPDRLACFEVLHVFFFKQPHVALDAIFFVNTLPFDDAVRMIAFMEQHRDVRQSTQTLMFRLF